jgi:hypothetical protein
MKDEIGGYLYYKNQENRAHWYWRKAKQGGSYFNPGRDLQDLRSEEDKERWRELEFKRHRLAKKYRKVVNLAALRIERARRRSA